MKVRSDMRPYLLQSRPYRVSQHWAAALESEWSSQLLLEKHLHLPPSVKPSDTRVGEAKGQIWFNNTFARPLFELVAQGVPCESFLSSAARVPIQTGRRACSDGTLCPAVSGQLCALAGTRRRARGSGADNRSRRLRHGRGRGHRRAARVALTGAQRLPHRVPAHASADLPPPRRLSPLPSFLPPPPSLPQRRPQLVLGLDEPVRVLRVLAALSKLLPRSPARPAPRARTRVTNLGPELPRIPAQA